jgi:hypothetical protein
MMIQGRRAVIAGSISSALVHQPHTHSPPRGSMLGATQQPNNPPVYASVLQCWSIICSYPAKLYSRYCLIGWLIILYRSNYCSHILDITIKIDGFGNLVFTAKSMWWFVSINGPFLPFLFSWALFGYKEDGPHQPHHVVLGDCTMLCNQKLLNFW